MKTGIAASLVFCLPTAATAFTASSSSVPLRSSSSASASATTHSSTTTRLFLDHRINDKIDLESAKVATMETLNAPSKKVYCRCWQSGTFPLCDGSHMKHNEKTGDNVGPLIVTVKKEE